MDIVFKQIGIIHTPFIEAEGSPIQPKGSNQKGKIELFKEYSEGLQDIEGFSHIMLFYNFHKIETSSLIVKPFMDDKKHGVFATRSPSRPNKLGISIVKLLKVEDNILTVENIDVLNGTPLIDIKPFVPDIDSVNATRIGWLENKVYKQKSTFNDGRFK